MQKERLEKEQAKSEALTKQLEEEKTNHEEYLKFKAASESDQKERSEEMDRKLKQVTSDYEHLRKEIEAAKEEVAEAKDEAEQAKMELDVAKKTSSELASKVKAIETTVAAKGGRDVTKSAPSKRAAEPPVTAASADSSVPKRAKVDDSQKDEKPAATSSSKDADDAPELSAMKAKLLAKKAALAKRLEEKQQQGVKRKADVTDIDTSEGGTGEKEGSAPAEGEANVEDCARARLMARKNAKKKAKEEEKEDADTRSDGGGGRMGLRSSKKK